MSEATRKDSCQKNEKATSAKQNGLWRVSRESFLLADSAQSRTESVHNECVNGARQNFNLSGVNREKFKIYLRQFGTRLKKLSTFVISYLGYVEMVVVPCSLFQT